MKIAQILKPKNRDQYGYVVVPAKYPLPHISLPSFLHTKTALFIKQNLAILTLFAVAATGYTFAAQFFVPKTVNYSFGASDCFVNPVVLPGVVKPRQGTHFKASTTPTFSLGNVPLYSHKTCLSATQPPIAERSDIVRLGIFGSSLFSKKVTVRSTAAPSVLLKTTTTQPVSTKSSLLFELNNRDEVFLYQLSGATSSVDCKKAQQKVECPLEPLQLPQGTKNDLSLKRVFNNQPVDSLANVSVVTLDPLKVTSASIASNQKVYTEVKEITVSMSKPVADPGKVVLESVNGATKNAIASTVIFDKDQLRITTESPLAREANYVLTLTQATATDGSVFDQPYTLNFSTSGGPVVTGVNIATYKTSPAATIVIQFDSELLAQTNAAQFVSLKLGTTPVAATASVQGTTITLKPNSTLPACSAITVTVGAGLTSKYGITGGKPWSFNSRTTCQTVFSIGSSVQGRAIRAYSFGSGASKVIFVGGMHGNEKSSTLTLDALVEDLEKNATAIPANKTIFVVPNTNPDGYAVNSRLNARGIDLNRNFESNNWQTDVMVPDGFIAGGGGSSPLSEPESSALAAFVLQQNPKLVLTYHATASVVISNDAGNSFALAQSYGIHSGYAALSNSTSDNTFEYSTTGEFEDWLHDKQSIPALLVELSTMSSNQFSSQKNAMWAMINASL